MNSQSWAQDVLRCRICETPVPPMYCGICDIHLCKLCVGEHLSDFSKEHKIVPFEKIGSTSKCPHHDPKIRKLYCEHCDTPVCLICASSEQHRGHKCVDIEKALLKHLKELEECIYPRYLAISSNILVQKVDLKTNSKALTTAIEKHAQDLHKEIDAITNKLKSDLAEMDAINLDILYKQKGKITRITSEIKQSIADLKKLLYSNDVSIFLAYKSKIAEFKKLLPYHKLAFPSFTPQEIKREHILQQFGTLSTLSIETEEHGCTVDTSYTESSPPDRPFLKIPEITTILDTAYGFFNPICGVSPLNDEEKWAFGWDNIMRLYNLQGELVKSVQTESGNRPTDMTVTQEGDLVYTDSSDRTVNIVKNTQIQTVIRLQGWKPRGICSTSSDDLLVEMVNDYDNQTKVVRYTGSDEMLSIQYDTKGQPLFSPHGLFSFDFAFNSIKRLSENRNQDICVSDRGAKAVVVVNKAGQLRFTYTGAPSSANGVFRLPFDPFGIATDSQSRILTTDCDNHSIHILDQNGVFLQFIENCKLQWPCGICVDINDNLFVAELRKGKIKKIQYYV